MKCPFCGNIDDKVIDSRMSKDGDVIRRRRECLGCERRFTSYEKVDDILPVVEKKDGRREQYDRLKILSGLQKACQKRPIPYDTLEKVTDSIEKSVLALGEKEIKSTFIGEQIMQHLKSLDKVAYVRFASVYREFKDVNEFMDEVKTLFRSKK
ncbi:MAG: transcriptional regulator NrdR [Thermodesulfovibrionales bacterium]